MWKPNAHYLRVNLVKSLCLPGLEDESLLCKDQIPWETGLDFPDTWHSGFREWKQRYMAFKTFKSDKLRHMNGSCLLCAGLRPCELFTLFPSHSEPAWLLQPQNELLLQFSAGRSSNPTFWQVLPFKTNQIHHYSSPSNPGTGKCPSNTTASPCPPPPVWHGSLPNTFDAVTPFPWSLCHFSSLPHFSCVHFSFSCPMGGRQTEICSRAEISVHRENLKSSRISTFQNKSQWMLK